MIEHSASMNSSEPLIRFDNVSVRFEGKTVIDKISFTVYQGDKFLIYGKSGIGKTTLFRLLLGLAPLQEGHISFRGQPINAQSIWNLRRSVAYVSQDQDIGSGRVHTLIKSFIDYSHSNPVADRKTRLRDLMAFFDLPGKILDEDYEKLSGGEKQRIALIIALLLERDIFLLDEITSSLDRGMKTKIIRYFTNNPSWTMLSISHDQYWLKRKGIQVIKVGV
jgi:putative ABC transport system ATP-binding protein